MLGMMAKLVLRRGPGALKRIRRQGALFDRHHPNEPHFYIQFVGCRQRDQGKGVGSALMKHGTRLADEAGMPAYLECSNHRNVPLYQRHGFDIRTQQVVGKNGPMAWFMWRDAR